MTQSQTAAVTAVMDAEQPQARLEEELLLAAALAATLIEYRRHVRQSQHTDTQGAGVNWRLVARLERLRGWA
jgi:hypothetical protein